MALTPEQKTIITSTVPLLESHGLEVTKTFYHNLLTDYPTLKDLFSLSAQITDHQAKALAGAVYAYAANINDLTPILPVVERINHKHASLNVSAAQYAIVGEYLLKAFRQVLSSDVFTAAIEDVWGAAYWQLANLMIKREDDIMNGQEALVGGWKGWRQMRLARKIRESSEITSFYWIPVDGGALPPYEPGQYVSIRVDTPDRKQIRQYSLSDASPPAKKRASATGGDYVDDKHAHECHTNGNTISSAALCNTSDIPKQYFRNSIKREAGKYIGLVSDILHNDIQEDDIIEMSNPAGDFYLPMATTTKSSQIQPALVLISAGVGQTPLLSMLNSITQSGATPMRRISYIHTARSSGTHAFASHIKTLTSQFPSVTSRVFHSQPSSEEIKGQDYDFTGRLNLDRLDAERDLFLSNIETEYYVCGPGPFMMQVSGWLVQRAVDGARIKMEVFGAGDPQA